MDVRNEEAAEATRIRKEEENFPQDTMIFFIETRDRVVYDADADYGLGHVQSKRVERIANVMFFISFFYLIWLKKPIRADC